MNKYINLGIKRKNFKIYDDNNLKIIEKKKNTKHFFIFILGKPVNK